MLECVTYLQVDHLIIGAWFLYTRWECSSYCIGSL